MPAKKQIYETDEDEITLARSIVGELIAKTEQPDFAPPKPAPARSVSRNRPSRNNPARRGDPMDEDKRKFKLFTLAAWKAHFSLEKFKEMMGNPSPEGERKWQAQYARAAWPFGDNAKGFEEFVRTMPG